MSERQHARLGLVVLSHPRPGSFCHALAHRCAVLLRDRGRRVELRDLYAEGFDPVLPAAESRTTVGEAATDDALVAEHQTLLAQAETLVVVHPNWWGKPPAMMAGWMDRVLAPGVVYRLGRPDAPPEPLLALRSLVVLNTSDTTPERETTVFGDPLQSIWSRCVGEYLPSAAFLRRSFTEVGASSAADRQRWLEELEQLLPQ